MNRTLSLLIVSIALAPPAFATDPVCWDRDMERIDTYGNPPSRGDNNFFTFTVSGTANVTMLYPGTKSMRAHAISLYEIWTGGSDASNVAPNGQGCQSTVLDNLGYFMPTTAAPPAASPSLVGAYNSTLRYPEPETTYSGGGGLADNFEATTYQCNGTVVSGNCKTNSNGGKAWEYLLWPANDSGTAHTAAGSTGTIDSECATAAGATSGNVFSDCQTCVAQKGYWLNYVKLAANPMYQGNDAMVVKGNWLNFQPPKWAMLRLAYKRLVNGPLLNPLREGIVTNCNNISGDPDYCGNNAGEYRLQKMLPQSCNGAGRPNQRISSTDTVSYNATTNPLAEMLFNTAWPVSADSNSKPPSTWSFFTTQSGATPALSTHPSSEPGASGQTNSKDGFCPGCNSGFSVMFTDGRGIDGWAACDSVLNGSALGTGTMPAFCKNSDGSAHDSNAACSGSTLTTPGLGLGAEDDGNDYLNPNLAGGAWTGSQGLGDPVLHAPTTPANTCPNDYVDDVAGWMFKNNMLSTQAGTNLRLYVVEIGSKSAGFGQFASVDAAASAGHGKALSATDFQTLENNINQIFTEIISTSTSFSVAAITTVQTRGTTFAFIPRFRPLLGSQWEGRLYRFRLFNEFAAGCGPADLPTDGGVKKTSLNPNGNNSCTDVYLTDSTGAFIGEDDAGNFVQLDTSATFGPTGWPIKTPTVLAQPVWEATHILECRENNFLKGSSSTCDDGGTPIARRQILTVAMDGGFPPASPAPLIGFNDVDGGGVCARPDGTTVYCNVQTMTSYMKFSGVNSDYCQSMSLVTRNLYKYKEDCGYDTIRFMEGVDVQHQNSDGGVVRPNILGDIFHSSPILVTPPVLPFLCDTGILNQCVRTLYAEDTGGIFMPDAGGAYAQYVANNKSRDELILVGADDGMLHAFQAGTATTLADGGVTYDEGTGVEKWAFIPPDMLPKLQRYVLYGSHQILIDGDPWVRDIWKDGSGASGSVDGVKQADEFHTIAIMAERGGGRHITALDLTDTSAQPKWLWTWPPVGSTYEMQEGESWNDTTPNPPPIGPILMADNSGPRTVSAGKLFNNGSVQVPSSSTKVSERWVVALGGGYDPNLIRGRAIYILDAWTGELLFKFSRYDTNSSSDPRYNLGPVASAVAMVDTNSDNYFDLATVGDAEGNLWTIDMISPGGTLASPNWFGGLAFSQFSGLDLKNRSPFFAMPEARVFGDSNGGVRVYMGAGDRDQIRTRDTDTADGGTCTVDNLRGCVRNGCSVDVKQNIFKMGNSAAATFTGEWAYAAGGTSLGTNSFTTTGTTTSNISCSDPAQLDVTYTVTCPGSTTLLDPTTNASPADDSVYCDFDGGNDAGEECPDPSGKPIVGVGFNPQTITNSRFYSIKLFDAPSYTNRPRMTSSSAQTQYNSHALSDTSLTNVTDGGVMGADAGGWFVVQANDSNEKTASSALLLAGCAVWNTLVPSNTTNPDGGSSCGGSGFVPSSTAYLYQANDDTGGISCGLSGSATQGTVLADGGLIPPPRFVARTIVDFVPVQPTPVVSLNAQTGQVAYSGISLEPGGGSGTGGASGTAFGSQGVQGDVSWLDVSRNLHNCRHDGGPCQ